VKPRTNWFNREYDTWYKGPEAPGALMRYLLDVDTVGFDPRGRAPVTEARDQMAAAKQAPESDHLVRALLEGPEGVPARGRFRGRAADLFTSARLVAMLDPDKRARLTERSVAMAFAPRGTRRPVHDAQPAQPAHASVAVRNRARWEAADHSARAAHYMGADAKKKEKF